jgi:hypothetical protein
MSAVAETRAVTQRPAKESDHSRSTTLKSKYICVGSFAYFADRFDARVPQHSQNPRWQFDPLDFCVVWKVWGWIEQQCFTSSGLAGRNDKPVGVRNRSRKARANLFRAARPRR